jgi:hypothetical protein
VAKKKPSAVFVTTEFFGNSVQLYTSTWTDHILVEHPQMVGYEALVRQVLRDPDEIRESILYSYAAAFISAAGLISPQGFRVIVKYDDAMYQKGSTSGIVATAYPVDLVNYQKPNLGKSIYRKKK